MKLARKLTLALVFGVFLVLALSAYVQVRREARIFENDVQRDHHTMGRALAAAVTEVWRSEGSARALRLVEDADPGLRSGDPVPEARSVRHAHRTRERPEAVTRPTSRGR